MKRVFAVQCGLVLLFLVIIQVHAAEPTSAPAKAPAAKAAVAANETPAEWPPDNAPMYRLAGRAGLPNYLKATSAVAGPQGLAAEEIRTTDTGLINKDFTFDVVFRFKNDDEQAIVMMGLGALGKDVGPTVYSRIHGPGHGGACTLSIAGKPETELGKLTHKAGPHLFRLEKRGSTLTMAISPDYDGKFDPAAVKTIPDVKDVAPNLTPRDSVAFIKGATTIVSVRLWINGKPAFTGKTPPRPAKTETVAAQPEATAEMPAEAPKETVATATPTPAPAPAPVRDGAPAAVAGDVKGTKIARRQTSIHGLVVMSTDTGAMLGGTSDLILTATPGEANAETPVTFVTPVGAQMTLVLDDVLRFIRIKYPVWEADKVELTFDDRISKKDGPSIGAALGTMLLSMLEGFEIDPKLAITGDVSADGKIRAIGGAVAKIRAAANGAGAEIVALPADNYNQVVDGLVYEGPTLLSKIQVIGIASLDDAAAIARVDRNVKLAEAIKLFGEVQEALKKSPGELKGKPVREKLTQVTALAPNHFSAKLLLLASQDKQPRKLSAAATMYYTSVAVRGVWPALQQQAWATDRNRVTPAAVKDGIKTLDKLRWIADPTMQPLVDAYRDFIRAVDNLQTGGGSVETLQAKIRAISDAETKVNSNRDVMEKMIKEGV